MKIDDYKYPIGQCDVPPERRSQLESYRANRRQWLTWLDGDEHHAIWTNLSAMVWTDVSYRTLRQLVIVHEDKNETSCLNNALVAEQIIQGYVARQVRDQAAAGQDIRRHFPASPHHRHAQQLAAATKADRTIVTRRLRKWLVDLCRMLTSRACYGAWEGAAP